MPTQSQQKRWAVTKDISYLSTFFHPPDPGLTRDSWFRMKTDPGGCLRHEHQFYPTVAPVSRRLLDAENR